MDNRLLDAAQLALIAGVGATAAREPEPIMETGWLVVMVIFSLLLVVLLVMGENDE